MAGRFKLLAGQHIEGRPNPDYDPEDPGAAPRKLSKTYSAPAEVVSETDLVKRFGPEKFQFVGGTVKETEKATGDAIFPNGQVSTGKQVSTSGPDGTTQSMVDQRGEASADNPKAAADKRAAAGMTTKGRRGGDTSDVSAEDSGEDVESDTATDTRTSGNERKSIEPDFEGMTVAELREYAGEKDIDLAGKHRKDEIIDAIREGMSE